MYDEISNFAMRKRIKITVQVYLDLRTLISHDHKYSHSIYGTAKVEGG